MERNIPENKNLSFSKIRERFYFIYNVAKIQQTKEAFFRILRKVITSKGNKNIAQGVVTR